MTTSTRHLNARRTGIILICSIFALLTLISIHRFGQAAMSGQPLQKSHLVLINITIAGLGILSLITFWQIIRSARNHRRKKKKQPRLLLRLAHLHHRHHPRRHHRRLQLAIPHLRPRQSLQHPHQQRP